MGGDRRFRGVYRLTVVSEPVRRRAMPQLKRVPPRVSASMRRACAPHDAARREREEDACEAALAASEGHTSD